MKTLYLECNMGAAGDMLMAALYELLPDKPAFLAAMNRLLPGVTVSARAAVTCGVTGTHMDVTVDGQAESSLDVAPGAAAPSSHPPCCHGRTLSSMDALLDALPLPAPVLEDVRAVYRRIAQAESQVHGVAVEQVHFHEVGALDAVADIAGVCLAMHLLSPDRVVVSPVHVGSGQVRCAHGVLPVPAPATALLLTGIPCYGGEIRGELCTPTGAALLAHFGQAFGPMPVMAPQAVGCGVGAKAFPAANCVRAFWGTADAPPDREEITELCCHIDDMTAEALAFAAEQLGQAGALDVSAAPITMKKGRAAVALTVLCRPGDEERLAQAVLRETSTLGVRARRCRRYTLPAAVRTVDTAYGPIRIKYTSPLRGKPEYEDVAAAARRSGLPFQRVWEDILLQSKEEPSDGTDNLD